jgi:hypothetical protein
LAAITFLGDDRELGRRQFLPVLAVASEPADSAGLDIRQHHRQREQLVSAQRIGGCGHGLLLKNSAPAYYHQLPASPQSERIQGCPIHPEGAGNIYNGDNGVTGVQSRDCLPSLMRG